MEELEVVKVPTSTSQCFPEPLWPTRAAARTCSTGCSPGPGPSPGTPARTRRARCWWATAGPPPRRPWRPATTRRSDLRHAAANLQWGGGLAIIVANRRSRNLGRQLQHLQQQQSGPGVLSNGQNSCFAASSIAFLTATEVTCYAVLETDL